MTVNSATPYAQLEPNVILAAIESLEFSCSGSLLPLNSYENRVYQIGIEDAPPLIAKFYRPDRWSNEAIIEEHDFALELVSHEIPVIAPLITNDQTLHTYQEFRFALFPRKGGRALEIDNLEQLEWMGRFIGRLHAVGSCKPFHHRLHLNANTYGYNPYQFLLEHDFIPIEIKEQYQIIVTSLLKKIDQYTNELTDLQIIRLHGDCHASNVLWSDSGPHIVDLDDCLMGPAIQDLWMLLPGTTSHEFESHLNCILQGYRAFHDFDKREIQLIEPLRTLRLIHYSAWLAKRWEDPTFPINFPWFGSSDYWKGQVDMLEEQTEAMQAPPLVA